MDRLPRGNGAQRDPWSSRPAEGQIRPGAGRCPVPSRGCPRALPGRRAGAQRSAAAPCRGRDTRGAGGRHGRAAERLATARLYTAQLGSVGARLASLRGGLGHRLLPAAGGGFGTGPFPGPASARSRPGLRSGPGPAPPRPGPSQCRSCPVPLRLLRRRHRPLLAAEPMGPDRPRPAPPGPAQPRQTPPVPCPGAPVLLPHRPALPGPALEPPVLPLEPVPGGAVRVGGFDPAGGTDPAGFTAQPAPAVQISTCSGTSLPRPRGHPCRVNREHQLRHLSSRSQQGHLELSAALRHSKLYIFHHFCSRTGFADRGHTEGKTASPLGHGTGWRWMGQAGEQWNDTWRQSVLHFLCGNETVR